MKHNATPLVDKCFPVHCVQGQVSKAVALRGAVAKREQEDWKWNLPEGLLSCILQHNPLRELLKLSFRLQTMG